MLEYKVGTNHFSNSLEEGTFYLATGLAILDNNLHNSHWLMIEIEQ
jgi:hypothetical protein